MAESHAIPVGQRALLSGDEAVALAAVDAQVALGTGYPGTPSTEILETFHARGGRAQWSPNEKVALEVGIGAAFGGARVLVTMKHIGVNVAADPLFTVSHTGIGSGAGGALVMVAADDPGMACSQNEQDSRPMPWLPGSRWSSLVIHSRLMTTRSRPLHCPRNSSCR